MSRRSPFDQGGLGDDDPGLGASSDDELTGYVTRASRVADPLAGTALSSFIRQMAAYPRLDAAEQTALALECQAAAESRRILASGQRISRPEERRHVAAVRRGDYAMSHLMGSTIRLVILIVRENAERRLGSQRALAATPDLVGECMIALTKAVYDFDPTRGPSFATYAARVVRDTVRMTLSNESTLLAGQIRVPAAWQRVRRIAAVRIPELTTELGRVPTDAEVYDALYQACLEWAAKHLTPDEQNLSPAARQEAMVAKLTKQGMLGALRHLDDVLNAGRPMDSLDMTVGDDTSSSLGDHVAAPAGDELFDAVERDELLSTISRALAELSDRERDIVILRYDLNRTGQPLSYKEISARYDVTPERIRQIERTALSKMRTDDLAGFLPWLPSGDEGDDEGDG